MGFFSVFQKNWVFGILGPPSYGIGREMLCLPYAGFFKVQEKVTKKYVKVGVGKRKNFFVLF